MFKETLNINQVNKIGEGQDRLREKRYVGNGQFIGANKKNDRKKKERRGEMCIRARNSTSCSLASNDKKTWD